MKKDILPEFQEKAFKKNGKMKKEFYEKELLRLQVELVKLQN